MKPINFEEQNVIFGKDQEEVGNLPAHYNHSRGEVSYGFLLNEEERVQLLKTGIVWFKQITGGRPLQPVNASVYKEEIVDTSTPEYDGPEDGSYIDG